MKSFIIALIFVSCVVSFSHADDGWATGYGNLDLNYKNRDIFSNDLAEN